MAGAYAGRMKRLLCLLLLAAAPAAPARTFLYAAEGAQQVMILDEAGRVAWSHPAEMARDAWQLPDGHVLFCYNNRYDSRRHDNPSGVMEVTPDHQLVFHFQTTGQVWSCQRLADGRTLVGAASQGRLLLVDARTQVCAAITLKSKPGHSCLRNARQIDGGNFLVAEESARAVREYAPDGALVREMPVAFPPYSALRRPGGHTLIGGKTNLVELAADGRAVWSLTGADLPELGLRWFAGLHLLPDGHLLVCNAGGQVPLFELDADRHVAWRYPADAPPLPFGHGLQRLDTAGPPLK